MATAPKKKKEYVNNAAFVECLIAYKKACKDAKRKKLEKPPIPNYIGECFMKIAEGLSHKPNFINYPCREDMIGDAIENCLMYFDNFDPEKSNNAFAYFTQIIYFAFLRRIQKEKKQLYVKYKATQQTGILDEHEFLEMDDAHRPPVELYDNISEFIENFEESKRKKKDKVKKEKGIENYLDE